MAKAAAKPTVFIAPLIKPPIKELYHFSSSAAQKTPTIPPIVPPRNIAPSIKRKLSPVGSTYITGVICTECSNFYSIKLNLLYPFRLNIFVLILF